MVGLQDLAIELLCLILKHVGPDDVDSFLLSCKRIHGIAGQDFIDQHELHKIINLTTVDNGGGELILCSFPDLLGLILDKPRIAGYFKTMVVGPWRVRRDVLPPWRRGIPNHAPGPAYPYSSHQMGVFEQLIRDTMSTSEERDRWVADMKAGDESPAIALLFPRLHHLSSLVIVLDNREDRFILQTLQRIAKTPHSSSLSRLRKVGIHGRPPSPGCFTVHTYSVQYLFACASLPSVMSLEGHHLLEKPLELAEDALELAAQSSSLQHLNLQYCGFSRDTLIKFIRSAQSLRSLTYTYFRDTGNSTHPSYTWVCETLLERAMTTLEELALYRPPYKYSTMCFGMGLDFKYYHNLGMLTIDRSGSTLVENCKG